MTLYKVQRYRVKLVKDGVQRLGRTTASCEEDAAECLRPFFEGLPHEEIWLLLLDARLVARGAVKVSQGGLYGAAVRVVDILRPVIASGYGQFVMAHNHPSGDAIPSLADIDTTTTLLEACKVVGLQMVDHLVFAGANCRSIRNDHRMPLGDW